MELARAHTGLKFYQEIAAFMQKRSEERQYFKRSVYSKDDGLRVKCLTKLMPYEWRPGGRMKA